MKTTYANAGVDYTAIDPFKILAQQSAQKTSQNCAKFNNNSFHEYTPSRGESVYLIETPEYYLAHVEEGLGTKNLVADAMYSLTGKSYYNHIAQCTVAMIVNDLITLGAAPLTIAMHLAAGSSEWFRDNQRATDLINGWSNACTLAECTWGGGETPTVKGIVSPETVALSGSAQGIISSKKNLIKGDIKHGDTIVIVESSGIHANGLTLAREICKTLPNGYLTKINSDITFGEALLVPTHIYVKLIKQCIAQDLELHYAINITGHGWRKLLRSPLPYRYIIDKLPTQLPIFAFLQYHGQISDNEAYGNFNMGAGFAIYTTENDAQKIISIASSLGLKAFIAGHIENGEKEIVINPKNLVYTKDTLAVR